MACVVFINIYSFSQTTQFVRSITYIYVRVYLYGICIISVFSLTWRQKIQGRAEEMTEWVKLFLSSIRTEVQILRNKLKTVCVCSE